MNFGVYIYISGNPYNIWQLQNEFSNWISHRIRFRHTSCFFLSSQVVRKKTAQVIYSSTVASSEVQEQVEVEDEVPSRSSSSRNVQPEKLPRMENLSIFSFLKTSDGGIFRIRIPDNHTIYEWYQKSCSDSKHCFHIFYNVGPAQLNFHFLPKIKFWQSNLSQI